MADCFDLGFYECGESCGELGFAGCATGCLELGFDCRGCPTLSGAAAQPVACLELPTPQVCGCD